MKNTLGPCLGCGQNKALINAHIIPRSWSHRIQCPDPENPLKLNRATDQNSVAVTRTQTRSEKAKPNAVTALPTDSSILCASCDGPNGLGRYDDALYKIWQWWIEHRHDQCANDVIQIEISANSALKGVAAILWRASVSTCTETNHISLGKKYNRLFQEFLFESSTLKHSEFAVSAELYLPSQALLDHQADTGSDTGDISLAMVPEVVAGRNDRRFLYSLILPGMLIRAWVGSPNGQRSASQLLWQADCNSIPARVREYDGSPHARMITSFF